MLTLMVAATQGLSCTWSQGSYVLYVFTALYMIGENDPLILALVQDPLCLVEEVVV